jgi:ribosomal protein S18 acetylase RimI-like enzyme
MTIEVVPATIADREPVTTMLVAAFAADPSLRWFLPGEDEYVTGATELFGGLFERRVGFGSVWVAGDHAAAALWEPPADQRTGVDRERETRLERSLRGVIGPAATARLAAYNDAVHELLPPEPYWYLGVLGVDPARAGTGLARAVMDAGRERARADGVPAVLETTNPSNVGYYERAGWRVIGSTVAPIAIWVLVDDPAR